VRILGIDPGTHVAGYGVVEAAGSRLMFVEAGVLRATRSDPLERRLARIAKQLQEVLERTRPEAAAVEEVFVKADPRAALAVGHGRGAVLAVLGEAGIPVAGYPPASIKKSLTGNGRADKARVGRMVALLLHLETVPKPADATDALAAAITHALGLSARVQRGV